MAGAANPLAVALQSKLAQLQGGAPAAPGGAGGPGGPGGMPGGPGGPGGSPEDDAAQQLQSQASELHGADPGALLRQLQKVRSVLGTIFVQTFQRLPQVSNQISMTLKQLDRAIKECQTAAQTASAVRKPIDFSMAAATQPQPGGGPSPATPPMGGQ
jgi:hypothetical protein